MGRTKEDKAALHRFFLSLLQGPEGDSLTRTAVSAVPGRANTSKARHSGEQNALTREQRDWLRSYVDKNYWSKLPKSERKQWYSQQPSGAAVVEIPGSSSSSNLPSAPVMPPTTEQPASSLPPLRASAKGEKRKRAERLLTRPPAKKHFRSKTFRQRRRHQKVLTCHLRRFPSAEQAADTVARAIRVVENEWPEFGKLVAQKLQPATVCGSCSSLVRGLGAVPEFKPPNPSDRIRAIRDQVDVLIHQAFPDRSAVENLGYSFGAARWLKASGPDDAQAKTRGRPSKVNSKACIEAVRAVLQAHSQDSSKICRSNPGGTAEWVIARTLTKDRTALFEDEPSLYENMSARTMHRIMKEHLCHFKKARCQSDYCQYCADYDDKVLPKAQEMIADARDQLEKIMPNYWQAWDAFLAAEPFKDLPALEIEAFEHYISRHHERHPCAEHRDNDFPCGLADLRKRGG